MRWTRTIFWLSLAGFLLASCAGETTAPAETQAKPPDETAALAALKEINQAQTDYIRRTRRYAQRTEELLAEKLLVKEPAVQGYSILMLPSPDAGSYTVTATPGAPEARHFFSDQTGVIRAEAGKPATKDSPAIQ